MIPTQAGLKVSLTRPLRITIMIALIALFFVGSPLLIMYTAGYRYDWDRHQIKSTGVISVDIIPTDAQITLNGIAQKKDMPLRLTDRAPGTYHIRIEKTGFRTWESNITVLSNQTFYVKNVQLFKDTQPRIVNNQQIVEVYATTKPGMVVTVTKLPTEYLVEYRSVYETGGNIIATSSLATLPLISISPAQDEALISINQADRTTVTLISFSSLSTPATFVYDTTSTPTFQWREAAEGSDAYIHIGETIERLSTNHTRRFFANTSSTVWFVDPKEILWSATQNSITSNNVPSISYAIDRTPRRILSVNESRILTEVENGYTIIPRNDRRTMFIPATTSLYHAGTREWWLASDWELWSVYENGDLTLLNRSANRIRAIRPLDQFGVALIMSDHALIGFNPGYYVSQTLAASTAQRIDTDWKNRTIYFINGTTTSSQLYTLDY